MKESKRLGLYLHIPFCLQKCRYCDFHSAPAGAQERVRYVQALCRHLAAQGAVTAGYEVDTVYFGGGTPSLLTKEDFSLILDTVRGAFSLTPDAEITAECNPATADGGKAEVMLAAGVNRLSIGLQSADPCELECLGRLHRYGEFEQTFLTARAAGFENISVDLMMGIPHQTPKSLAGTLDTVLSLSPEHLSLYGLRIEPGTPFYAMRAGLALPDEDAECEMAELAEAKLRAAGYEHYEVSNYARPGYRSRHNMRYWLGEAYLGFGPGAHSYFEGERFDIAPDTAAYIKAVEAGAWQGLYRNREAITGKALADEYVMLRMRLFDGVELADYERRFGSAFEDNYPVDGTLFERGLLTHTPRGIAFTEAGMRVSNAILSDWLDFGN